MTLNDTVPEPIFKVKKDIDLFKLYGSEQGFGDKDEGVSDIDGISDDLQSMRIRLAVMKAKEQCDETEGSDIRQEAIDEVDSNLREIIALESTYPNEIKPHMKKDDAKKKARHPQTAQPVKLVKEEKDKVSSQINSQLNLITTTFSKIFQALIVLMNEHNLTDQSATSTVEMNRINKRSREFEARLQRLLFEAKQKAIVLKATMVKYRLHDNKKTNHEANKALYQSLRCVSSIMAAYLSHLPLSGRHLFPSSLQNLFEVLSTVAYLAKDLEFNDASQMISDSHRLSAVFNQFQAKFRKNDEEDNAKSPASKMFGSTKNLNIINGLAKEKFGAPPSGLDLSLARSPRRKSNMKRDAIMKSKQPIKSPRTFSGLRPKQKEIIPKPTKLLQDRVKASKQKIYGEQFKEDANIEDCKSEIELDHIHIEDDISGGIRNERQSRQTNENENRLSRVSVSSHSYVDTVENILSVHSPRPSMEEVSHGRRSSKGNPPLSTLRKSSHEVRVNEDLQNTERISNPSPAKSHSSSFNRKNSGQDFDKQGQAIARISRQSTISQHKDEDTATDIGNQRLKSRKESISSRREKLEGTDVISDESCDNDSYRGLKHRVRNAGFGNVLSFASEERLQALDRFSNTPLINNSVIKGNYASREGKRKIEISKDELDHIVGYKEKFRQDQAYSHFSNSIKDSKFNFHNENPYNFIRTMSEKVTDEIIENVCHEMVTTDIVNDLIQRELET